MSEEKNMIDLHGGTVKIADDLQIYPEYSFEQFRKTSFFGGHDGVRVIYLEQPQVIDGRSYYASLFFRNGKIYMLSLVCGEKEFFEEDEPQRKMLHDEILAQYGISGEKEFAWGRIVSDYDARSNCSSIKFIYS